MIKTRLNILIYMNINSFFCFCFFVCLLLFFLFFFWGGAENDLENNRFQLDHIE